MEELKKLLFLFTPFIAVALWENEKLLREKSERVKNIYEGGREISFLLFFDFMYYMLICALFTLHFLPILLHLSFFLSFLFFYLYLVLILLSTCSHACSQLLSDKKEIENVDHKLNVF